MVQKSIFPLTGFHTYLQGRGLKVMSAAMYAARVRSALRLAVPGEMPDAEAVARALLETHPLQQPTFRTAWRHYQAYLKTVGYTVADLPKELVETDKWLAPLKAALHRLLPVVQMTPVDLRYLTYGRIDQTCKKVDGVIFYATPRPLARKQPPGKILHATETDAITAFLEIVDWGYPNKDEPPEEDSPFLPYANDAPMPIRIIQQLCAGIRRKPAIWNQRPWTPETEPAAKSELIGSRESPPLFDLSLMKPPS